MDFMSFPADKKGYDTVFVVVDRLSKWPVSIPYQKATTIKEIAQLYIQHIYAWTEPLDIIVSDWDGQFISEF